MGYALIVGGGTDGRYTISLDIGEAERADLVARFTAQEAEAQAKLAAAQAVLDEKTAELNAAAIAYNDATGAYIALQRGETEIENAEQFMAIVDGYFKAQADYILARTEHAAALANKNALSFSASQVTKALAAWQAQVLTETREAWCTDFTEDATGYVATLEIPGESDLILITPGGRAPVLATDGYLRSRSLMAPWQAYFNAAILPGWQKFKPTYRWGTITALDEDTDTATVALAEARSSTQRLSVNQATTLESVPVEYMECNSAAFNVGDRVIVQFQGQDWESPRVIGFLDNPKACSGWRPKEAYVDAGGVAGPPRDLYVIFTSVAGNTRVLNDFANTTSISADYRIDGGNWVSMTDVFDPVELPIIPSETATFAGSHSNSVTLSGPDYVFFGSGRASSPGAPASVRVFAVIDSGWSSGGPRVPYGSVLEVRITRNGETYFNAAVQVNFLPVAVDSEVKIPDGAPNLLQLDYILHQEEAP